MTTSKMGPNDMFEKAGLSSLERLIGKTVDSVCFVQDYVLIAFDNLILTCYTMPLLSISGEKFGPSDPGFKDKICHLIGKSAETVSEEERKDLVIYFDGDEQLIVSLRPADAKSVEAAMLHETGGAIFNVWRYE